MTVSEPSVREVSWVKIRCLPHIDLSSLELSLGGRVPKGLTAQCIVPSLGGGVQ